MNVMFGFKGVIFERVRKKGNLIARLRRPRSSISAASALSRSLFVASLRERSPFMRILHAVLFHGLLPQTSDFRDPFSCFRSPPAPFPPFAFFAIFSLDCDFFGAAFTQWSFFAPAVLSPGSANGVGAPTELLEKAAPAYAPLDGPGV